MNNETKLKLKIILILLLLFINFAAEAQENRRSFSLKVGDEFEREILVNSNSSLQRGEQTLEIGSISTLTKSLLLLLVNRISSKNNFIHTIRGSDHQAVKNAIWL